MRRTLLPVVHAGLLAAGLFASPAPARPVLPPTSSVSPSSSSLSSSSSMAGATARTPTARTPTAKKPSSSKQAKKGATAPADPLHIDATTMTLKNGLRAVLIEDHAVPRVHLSVRVQTGSAHETPGRTGFAHLFEHLMFEGSRNVPEGKFDQWLEAAGGNNNAYTSDDVTYYYEEGPKTALDLMLFLESDRRGFFLDKLDASLVDGQRDVVKNERRQSYENQPYGKADLAIPALLWPKGHPYSWPVIGSMEDLSAASIDDVRAFFTAHYAPANSILVLVGDFETDAAKAKIEHWFSDVASGAPPSSPPPAPVTLAAERRAVFEDDVELPRVTLVWPSAAVFTPDDAPLDLLADLLASGQSSRLVKRLVHELRIAQSVVAYQDSRERAGQFTIEVTAFPGTKLANVVRVVDEEVKRLLREGPTEGELGRARTVAEAQLLDQLDSLQGKAGSASTYMSILGDPDGMARDVARYRAVTVANVAEAGRRTLTRGRLVVSVVPEGQLPLAVLSPVLPVLGGVQ